MSFMKRAAVSAFSLALLAPAARPEPTADDIFGSNIFKISVQGCTNNNRLVTGEFLIAPSLTDLNRDMRKANAIDPKKWAGIDDRMVDNWMTTKTPFFKNFAAEWQRITRAERGLSPGQNDPAKDRLSTTIIDLIRKNGEIMSKGISLFPRAASISIEQTRCAPSALERVNQL